MFFKQKKDPGRKGENDQGPACNFRLREVKAGPVGCQTRASGHTYLYTNTYVFFVNTTNGLGRPYTFRPFFQ